MAKKHPEIEELEELEAKDEEERSRLYEATRKVVLASVGAVGLAQDELENFVQRLVKRGEIAEKDARKLMKEASDKRRKSAKGLDKQFEKQLNRAMEWINIPTKRDIEELSDKIGELTDKIEELKKEKAHA
jgi:poly(hydroxyalkanoate) granule-associated protein